jgi:hypothetical protein
MELRGPISLLKVDIRKRIKNSKFNPSVALAHLEELSALNSKVSGSNPTLNRVKNRTSEGHVKCQSYLYCYPYKFAHFKVTLLTTPKEHYEGLVK